MKNQLSKEKSIVSLLTNAYKAVILHVRNIFVKFVTSILIRMIYFRKRLVRRGNKVLKLHNYLILKNYEQTD